MTITKTNGGYTINDIIADQYVEQQYLYYTKREAIKKFKEKYQDLYQIAKESRQDFYKYIFSN